MQIENNEAFTPSFYAVLNTDSGEYFAGFNPEENRAESVTDPLDAKLFSNKHDIKLRPNEQLVEIEVDLTPANTRVSDPCRPRRRERKVHA